MLKIRGIIVWLRYTEFHRFFWVESSAAILLSHIVNWTQLLRSLLSGWGPGDWLGNHFYYFCTSCWFHTLLWQFIFGEATLAKGILALIVLQQRWEVLVETKTLRVQQGKNVSVNSKQLSVSSPVVPQSKAKAARASSPVPSCSSCGIIITDDIKALQCDRCQDTHMWMCADCLNLPHDMYNHLVSDPNCSLRWFCTTCDKRAMDTSNTCHNPDKLDSLVTMVEKLLDKLMILKVKWMTNVMLW